MITKFSLDEFGKVGKVVKKSDVYTVIDVSKLENLMASITVLHPGKETSGHSHGEAEEVYLFMEGEGVMKVGEERSAVKKGDIVLIPKGSFHKVYNETDSELKFVSVFEKYGERS